MSEYDAVLDAARRLVDAMDTCHVCRAKLLVDDTPVHCEDGCSYNCEDHEEPDCAGIDVLHGALDKELKKVNR